MDREKLSLVSPRFRPYSRIEEHITLITGNIGARGEAADIWSEERSEWPCGNYKMPRRANMVRSEACVFILIDQFPFAGHIRSCPILQPVRSDKSLISEPIQEITTDNDKRYPDGRSKLERCIYLLRCCHSGQWQFTRSKNRRCRCIDFFACLIC